jgi:hypothetical protein
MADREPVSWACLDIDINIPIQNASPNQKRDSGVSLLVFYDIFDFFQILRIQYLD